jgi:hypothetical protein
MGNKALAAILDPCLGVGIITLAALAQGIQRAVTEEAVEILRMVSLVTGEELALLVLKERILTFLWLFLKQILRVHRFEPPIRWFMNALDGCNNSLF